MKMNIYLPFKFANPAYTMRTRWAVSKSKGVCLEIGCNLGRMTTLLAEKHASWINVEDDAFSTHHTTLPHPTLTC